MVFFGRNCFAQGKLEEKERREREVERRKEEKEIERLHCYLEIIMVFLTRNYLA